MRGDKTHKYVNTIHGLTSPPTSRIPQDFSVVFVSFQNRRNDHHVVSRCILQLQIYILIITVTDEYFKKLMSFTLYLDYIYKCMQ